MLSLVHERSEAFLNSCRKPSFCRWKEGETSQADRQPVKKVCPISNLGDNSRALFLKGRGE